MRIIAGRFRGRTIEAPPGRLTRPTSDRAREALFSRLDSLGVVADAQVLDVFAGSGALGLEALSRGANHVTFVENDPSALKVLRANLASLAVGDETTLVCADLLRAPISRLVTDSSCSLLLLDPPYRIDKSEVTVFIESMVAAGALGDGACVSWEHAAGEVASWPTGFVSLGSREYGTTEIDIAIYGEEVR